MSVFGRKKKAAQAKPVEIITEKAEDKKGVATTMEKKKIAVLTSGGDAPGMNAVVRAVTRTAITKGYDVIGFNRGYEGLISMDYQKLELRSVSDTLQRGGTILCTARSKAFTTDEGVKKGAENLKELNVEGIVVVGGDGTFRGALALAKEYPELSVVGVPGTIDNDISCSDYTIGFDTAVNTAMEMIDKIRDTTESHGRCSIVEVMGRNAGYIAVEAGIACGATAILVPEEQLDKKALADRLNEIQNTGKRHFIIIVAEGVNYEGLEEYLAENAHVEVRTTILGHVQRGGLPTARDRLIATEMGYRAVELIDGGCKSRVVAIKDSKLVDYEMDEALKMKKHLDPELLKVANTVSI